MSKSIKTALLTSLVLLAAGGAQAGTIKKCKDADGRWHYGDNAAAACAQSKVIEMTGAGRTTKVHDAPPSAGDLEAFRKKREAALEAQQKAEQQKQHDKVLLSTYSHEEDLIYARDRQVGALDNSINSGEQTLKSLRSVLGRLRQQAQEEEESQGKISAETKRNLEQSEAQVNMHADNLEKKKKEKEELRARFDKDLERYRELKMPKPSAEDIKKVEEQQAQPKS